MSPPTDFDSGSLTVCWPKRRLSRSGRCWRSVEKPRSLSKWVGIDRWRRQPTSAPASLRPMPCSIARMADRHKAITGGDGGALEMQVAKVIHVHML